MDFREEALEKLKHNNVSAATMDVWIAGYIAGREESDRLLEIKYEAKEYIPYTELWIKNSDGTVTKTINIGLQEL